MSMHLSNPPALVANPSRARDLARKNVLPTRDISGNSGTLKRFERFISPYLPVNTLPPEDLLDSLIQRNSWLR